MGRPTKMPEVQRLLQENTEKPSAFLPKKKNNRYKENFEFEVKKCYNPKLKNALYVENHTKCTLPTEETNQRVHPAEEKQNNLHGSVKHWWKKMFNKGLALFNLILIPPKCNKCGKKLNWKQGYQKFHCPNKCHPKNYPTPIRIP